MGLVNKPAPKETMKESFIKKGFVEQRKLKEAIVKMPVKLPGSPSLLSKEEKKKMDEELFGKKEYGRYIDRREYSKRLRELTKQKKAAKTFAEKYRAVTEIDILKRTLGQ